MSPRTGEVIAGRYTLDRLIEAEDGQRVYVADDVVLTRKVQLRMPEGTAPDPVGDDRLRREGRLLARVAGPGVARVLDALEPDGRPLIVTEHVAGSTLAQTTRTSAATADRAVRQALSLIDALAGVRARLPSGQVPVHRTILIDDDTVTITGLRERAAGAGSRDPAVAAVCETLYELLTARRPGDPDRPDAGAAPPGTIPDSMAGGIPAHVRLALTGGLDGGIETLAQLRAALAPPETTERRLALPPTNELVVGGMLLLVVFALLFGLVSQCTGDGDAPAGSEPVQTGVVTVPDLGGLRQGEAEDRVEDAGLQPFVTTTDSDEVEEGVVAEQTPAAGEETPAGSRVVIGVSSGTAPVRVPDVRGLSLDEARDAIRENGLLIRGLRFRPAPERPGTVLGTVPQPGRNVAPGTEVVVVVSR